MKRCPSKSTRNAPSPRTASEISGCWPRESGPSHITVGWNCTNSRSRSTAPARSASAIPSPVETDGFVVCGEHLAETAAGEHHRAAADRADAVALALAHHVQGDARRRPPVAVRGSRSTAERVLDDLDLGRRARPRRPGRAGSRRRWRRRRRARSGRGGGRPRGSATARRRRSWSKSVPSAISSRTASGPSVTSTRTASSSQAPAPATRVSSQVLLGGVPGPERGGDAALGPLGRAGGEDVLGDHQHRAARRAARIAARRSARRCRSR